MADCHCCDLCHTWRATPGRCEQIACLACGAVQCHSNGGARGCCRECHYGRLPGWSFSHHPRTCQFKGCTEPAVYAYLPGQKKDCCLAHGRQVLERQEARRAAKAIQHVYVGDRVTVRGVACRVIAKHAAGTVDVEAIDGSGCWRVSGLAVL